MRLLILADETIPADELEEVLAEHKRMYRERGVPFSYDIEWRDHSSLPYSNYWSDGNGMNRGIDQGYLKKEAKKIWNRYYRRYDNLVFAVDAEHWVPAEDGIWGWNLSNEMSGYEIGQVRFDTVSSHRASRIANSLGTNYHEGCHSHDQYCYRLKGVRIKKIVGVKNWDDGMVHGGAPQFAYIRHRENLDAIEEISSVLAEACAKRKRQHDRHISTIEELIDAYRAWVNYLTKEDQPIRRECVLRFNEAERV